MPSNKPIDTPSQADELTLLGKLIAEISKFGGADKQKASRLARILLPHIDVAIQKAHEDGYREASDAQSRIELPKLKWMQIICSENAMEWRTPLIEYRYSLPIMLVQQGTIKAELAKSKKDN